MKTLIIATRDGTRLKLKKPKCLVRISKHKLIELILNTCKNAGLEDFLLVTGYKAEMVEKSVKNIASKYKIRVKFIYNDEWEKENGISVYKAKEWINEKFLLLMSDHLFEPAMLNKLLTYSNTQECIIGVDKDLTKLYDLEEATKVKLYEDKVIDIGKHLNNYNAVDTGLFLLNPLIFEVLEGLIAKKQYKLNDAFTLLARRDKLQAADLSGYFWIDIDTKQDLQFAREVARKFGW